MRTELGLSRLLDGRLLRDAVAADPPGFFGPDHAARRGADPRLLVKLLDAGERLPVHVHPDDAFAHETLGVPYGKTEAWIVIATAGPTATMHVGFREEVSAATLAGWVRDQDAAAMLDALNAFEVRSGDALFVPGGTPHAIGEGALIVELQEPSDLSILLEWRGFADEAEAGLGLGWDVALQLRGAFGVDPDRIRGRRREGSNGATVCSRRSRPILPAPSGSRGRRRPSSIRLRDPRFHRGRRGPASEDGKPLRVGRGDTVLVPWNAGLCRLEGEAVAIACRPPAADAGGPE